MHSIHAEWQNELIFKIEIFSLQDRGIEIWARPIAPVVRADFSYAIVFLNRRTDGTPSEVSVINRELGLTHQAGYRVEDLYADKDYGILSPDDKITVDVNPSGIQIFVIFCS